MDNVKKKTPEAIREEIKRDVDSKRDAIVSELDSLSRKARSNKTVLVCNAIVRFIIAVAYIFEVIKGARDLPYVLAVVALCLIPVAIEFAIYKKDSESTYLRYAVGIFFAILYVFILFTTVSPVAFVYIIPTLITISLYSDIKYSVSISVIVVVFNAVKVIMDIVNNDMHGATTADYEIRLLIMILVSSFAIVIAYVTDRINKLEKKTLEDEKAKVSALLDKIINISGAMSKDIVAANSEITVLEKSIDKTKNAMLEVSTSSEETANSVQDQLLKTEEIQNNIVHVKELSENISTDVNKTSVAIEVGKGNVESLIRQSKISEEANAEAVNELLKLNEHTEKMQSIIDVINNITTQTSLLALNASIEAARAGEAGKGFAVVAGEISNLANQTNSATENITDLINNIYEELGGVTETINKAVKDNKLQNKYAKDTANGFADIEERAKEINRSAKQLEDALATLASANESIVDSVQTISAITEEVSANSTETYKTSEKNAEIVTRVTALMNELSNKAKELEDKN